MSPKRTPTGPAFRVEAKALAAAAAWVGKRIPSRPSIPIIAGMHLAVADGTLTLTAFDGDAAAVAEVDVIGDTDGTVLVSGRLLALLVGTFPGKPVDVETTGTQMTMRCGTITVTLPTMPVEDYPTPPKPPPVVGSVDGQEFAAAVARVAIGAGRDDTLPELTGVRLSFTAEQIQILATDRYRVVRDFVNWSMDPAFDFAVSVPADVLAATAKAMSGAEVIAIGQRDGLIGFSGDGLSTVSRLIDKPFPEAAGSFIVDKHPRQAVVNIAELIDAVKRARLVAEEFAPCRLSFGTDDTLTVQAAGRNDGEATGEQLSCTYTGSPVTVGLKTGYLLDVLGALPGDTAQISINTPLKPVQFAVPGESTYRHVVMPIRIGGNPA
jgi:DNA polymerase-3 subunit beta